MYSERALHQYTATSVETGSPVQLVAMLYEGALRFLHEAEAAIDRRDFQGKANHIGRAMRIVQELGNALDENAAPEIVQRLRALYEFAEYEMLQASTFNDARHLHNARRVLQALHVSWRELADRNVEATVVQDRDATTVPHVDVPTPPPAPATPWIPQTEHTSGERLSGLCLSA
jgi:flagellar secretion chaperone FliS